MHSKLAEAWRTGRNLGVAGSGQLVVFGYRLLVRPSVDFQAHLDRGQQLVELGRFGDNGIETGFHRMHANVAVAAGCERDQCWAVDTAGLSELCSDFKSTDACHVQVANHSIRDCANNRGNRFFATHGAHRQPAILQEECRQEIDHGSVVINQKYDLFHDVVAVVSHFGNTLTQNRYFGYQCAAVTDVGSVPQGLQECGFTTHSSSMQ